jgi:hypothetical protein
MALAGAGFLPFAGSSEVREVWLQAAANYPPGIRTLVDANWVTAPWARNGQTRLGLVHAAAASVLDGSATWEKAAKTLGQ